MTSNCRQFLPCDDIPNINGRRRARRSQPTVRRQTDHPEKGLAKARHFGATFSVPYVGCVHRDGCDTLAIVIELRMQQLLFMASEYSEFGASPGIPQARRLVDRCCQDARTVGAKRTVRYRSLVTPQYG